MTTTFITTDTISDVSNGWQLSADFSYLYVGANASLGSTLSNGRGVVTIGTLQSIDVAGHVFGFEGVEVASGSADIHVFSGGSIAAAYVAIDCSGSFVSVTNEGTISGSRGLYADGNALVVNSGVIGGQSDSVFILGNGTVTNIGTLTSSVSVNGIATISNYGTILGSVGGGDQADTIINRGLIARETVTGAGDDLVDGIGGRFERGVYLGIGNDTFWGGDATDVVIGDAGQDDIDGGGGNDRFNVLNGDGSDIYDGGAGNDYYDARALTGALVVDLLAGQARNTNATDLLTSIERVYGGAGSDRITGDALSNLLRGGAGNDTLYGGDGNDHLFGEAGRNSLYGGNGDDRLVGGDLIDVLSGGAGNDRITGGLDVDVMYGGSDVDRFIFTDFEDFISIAGGGIDRIVDFLPGTDLIDLSAIDALAAAGDQAFSFIGTGTITAFGQLSYRTTATTTIISIGFNTASAFDVIRLDGVHTLTAADFVL
jgi:Ca2+-binding RTX toxin-like protein